MVCSCEEQESRPANMETGTQARGETASVNTGRPQLRASQLAIKSGPQVWGEGEEGGCRCRVLR